MHLTAVAGGKHRGGYRVRGGIHDHAHGNEGHPVKRGNLRDQRTFHVDRCGAGLPKGVFLGQRGADHPGTGKKPAAGHVPLRTEGCGERFTPVPRGGKGRPVRGNDFTREENIASREPGIESTGHTPADERRGAVLDE